MSCYIPDFNINTDGDTLTDALEMAKDAIGIIGIVMEDRRKQALPTPSVSESSHKRN